MKQKDFRIINFKNNSQDQTLLLCHGLNNKSKVMEPLANSLNHQFSRAILLELPGHEDGSPICHAELKQWVDYLDSSVVKIYSDFPATKLSAIGYSLGANLILRKLVESPATFEKVCLLAPAIFMAKRYTTLLSLMSPLRHFGVSLTSRNDPDYRACSKTSLGAYHSLLGSSKSLRTLNYPDTAKNKILFMLSEQDELLDVPALKSWSRERNFVLKKIDSGKDCRCAHMVLNEKEVGEVGWNQMNQDIKSFLTSTVEH